MNNKFRQFLTKLLCAAMVLSSVPVNTFASEVTVDNVLVQSTDSAVVSDGINENSDEILSVTGSSDVDSENLEDIVTDAFSGIDNAGELDAAKPSDDMADAAEEPAETETYGEWEYSYSGINATLTKYNGTSTVVNIPASVGGYSVIALGSNLFSGNTAITSVTIPDTVTSIGYRVFNGCSSLKSITIPKNVTSIDSYNFNFIENVTFESGMSKIPNNALYGAKKLTSVTIPATVTEIGSSAFYDCSSLSGITLPGELTTIGSSAFYGCTLLENITIPKNVKNISSYAFNSVKNVTFESGMTKIPQYALSNASLLESVAIPASVTEIGYEAFYYCKNLTSVQFPAGLKTIANYAFYYCEKLENVSIPDGCNVGQYAFGYCKAIKTINIGKNVTLGQYVFSNCSAINAVNIGEGLEKENNSFGGTKMEGNKDGVAWSVDLDSGVMEIGGSGAAPDYTEDNGAPWGGLGSVVNTVTLRNFTSIGSYFFKGMTNLTAISIPESVTSIGAYAFYGCSGIKYIEIPAAVTAIYDQAFGGCAGVREVVFCGDAPIFKNACFPQDKVYTVYYPEKSSGWVEHVKSKFKKATIKTWDNSAPTKDVVLVLDRSGSMSGRMESLKQASNTFVNEIGGRVHNTRIAVISYDDTTAVESDFTTDRLLLNERINQLYDRGGTEYLKALNAAENLLNTSSADYRFMIMFSDGEPNDNKDNIYQKAAQMQQTYMMYSVGLGTSQTQRDVLINVAGDESRYFEAGNIDALIQAFLDLASNLGRGEETNVSIKRNGERTNLLEDEEIFCIGSDETVTIETIVSSKLKNAVTIALMQSGKKLAESRTGVFDIQPGKLFVNPGEPVYIVIYDASGKIIEKFEINIIMREYFTATYYMNDGTDTIYAQQHVVKGSDLAAPEGIDGTKGVPEREGYAFNGWFATEQCIGSPFFSDEMTSEREAVNNDISLYAKWKRSTGGFEIAEDGWSFLNNTDPFHCYTKEISTGDYAKLTYNLDENTLQRVEDYKNKQWNGSCFGMSSSATLIKDGMIALSKFDPNYVEPGDVTTLYWNTAGDADVGNIESMINFYHLRQMIGNVYDERIAYSDSNESDNIKGILAKMQSSNKPVVLCLGLFDSGSNVGGHAVVAYNLKDNNDGTYSFKVYDCSMGNTTFNNPGNGIERSIEYDVNITRSGDTYYSTCPLWETAWGYDIMLYSALTVDDLVSERILLAPSVVNTLSSSEQSSNVTIYRLVTSYGNFTITDGNRTAAITNGRSSGDLTVKSYGNLAEIGEEPYYVFEVPALQNGDVYTITQTSGEATYFTAADYPDSQTGFYSSVRSAQAGTVIISADGSITTSYPYTTAQTINVTRNDLNTDWYNTNLQGNSTGFEIGIRNNKTQISSSVATTANIKVNNVFNSLTFENVALDSTPVTVEKNANGDCVIVKAGSELKNAGSFGYSVVFDSQCGSSVSSNTNVKRGDKVEEPADPTRDGYVFEGWFKEAACENLWDFDSDTVTGDTVLYAGWSINSGYYASVTFKIPGVNDKSVYTIKGSELTAANCPVNPYDTSGKWYKDADYTDDWDPINDRVSNDITLYGKGKICAINYVTGCAVVVSANNVYAGRKIAEPVTDEGNKLTRDGYTLVGWSTDPNGDFIWNFKTDRVNDSMTLYACWIENMKDSRGNDTGICIEILNRGSLIYTGNAIIPQITVMDKGNKLIEGTDYKVSYKNNVNACDIATTSLADSKKPQVIVKGIGAYKSSKQFIKYFTIIQADAAKLKVTVPGNVIAKSKNALQAVKAEVKLGNKVISSKDYSIVYRKDSAVSGNEVTGIGAPGNYYIAVEGKKSGSSYTGNIKGLSAYQEVLVADKSVAVVGSKVTHLNKTVCLDKPLTQEQTIQRLMSKVVIGGTTYFSSDYVNFAKFFTVTATDENGKHVSQKNIGNVLLTTGVKTIKLSAASGNEKGYVGNISWKLTVTGTALKRNMFTLTYDTGSKKPVTSTSYTGKAMKPFIVSTLKENVDYSVSYLSGKNVLVPSQLVDAGKYTAVITGKGKYSGTQKIGFTIDKVNIAKAYKEGTLRVFSSGTSVTYDPAGAKPGISISYDADGMDSYEYDRISLIKDADYKLSYSGNKKTTTWSKLAYATVQGKGNFTGKLKGDGKSQASTKPGIAKELNYQISRKNLNDTDIIVNVTGIKMSKGKISKVTCVLYDGSKKIGTREYSVGRPSESSGYFYVYVSSRGANYTGSRYLYINSDAVNAADNKNVKITLSANTLYYTGDQIRPGVSITDASGADITGKFKITYGENIKIGNGTVIIEGIRENEDSSSARYISIGRKVLTFKILPKWAEWLF